MSYCRLSDDNFKCDVYIYENLYGGYTTHVAGGRYSEEIPKLLEIDNPEFAKSYRAQMDFLKTAKLEPILLPYAGKSFNDDLVGLLWRITELRRVGYNIPEYVFKDIKKEIKEKTMNEQTLEWELWDMVGEIDTPMFLIKRYPDYLSAWSDFVQRIKTIPCVIICNKRPEEKIVNIYESPDGGKTVYKREFGKYDKRELVKE